MTRRMPRFASLALAVIVALAASFTSASRARAGAPLLVMLEPERRDALAPALAVELAWRDVELLLVDSPDGATPLARAAAAQEACRFVGGTAAVFVEDQTVRLVGADGETVRHAPLPSPFETIEPRIFAVVAHSLLAEMLGPPEPPIRVTVAIDAPGREVTLARVVPGENGGATAEVHVAQPPAELTAPPVPPPTPTPPIATDVGFERSPMRADGAKPEELALADGDVDDAPILPREGFFVEGNVLFAGIALGGGVGLGWQLHEDVRLSLGMNAAAVLDGYGNGAYMPQVSLTRVGGARSGRFDFGAQAGLVFVEETVDDYVLLGEPTAFGGSTDTPTSDGTTDMTATRDSEYTSETVLRVGWALGGFFGWTWEVDDWIGVGVRLSLQVASIEGSGPIVAPMLTAHTELPI